MNCLVKQFAMCLGVIAILWLNVMDVFTIFIMLIKSYLIYCTRMLGNPITITPQSSICVTWFKSDTVFYG